ncbi:MAG: alpha-amylase family glycosyl hydrolase, partial [Pirellula sp.]
MVRKFPVQKLVSWLALVLFLPPILAQDSSDLPSGISVRQVEPPSWWVASKTSPIRLLITGQGFTKELTISADREGLQFTNLSASPNGHYLFADLHIAPDCAAGPVRIEISRNTEASQSIQTQFLWNVLEYPSNQPAGFGPEDFIYFLMPDRFCDSDPANNRPAKSPDIYDRKKSRFYHGGDIQGITSKLDYIQSLGATAIWTTPIYDNNDAPDLKEMHPEPGGSEPVPTTGYHGYGAIDLYRVDEHFGTLEDLKTLIDQAHKRGMKVIQ